MKNSVEPIFQAIDRKDSAGFASFLTQDAKFRFANAPAISGKAKIEDAVAGFLSTIKGLEHRVLDVWAQDDAVICEGEVTYTRKDDYKLTLPFVDIFRMRGELIADYRIYIDISSLLV